MDSKIFTTTTLQFSNGKKSNCLVSHFYRKRASSRQPVKEIERNGLFNQCALRTNINFLLVHASLELGFWHLW